MHHAEQDGIDLLFWKHDSGYDDPVDGDSAALVDHCSRADGHGARLRELEPSLDECNMQHEGQEGTNYLGVRLDGGGPCAGHSDIGRLPCGLHPAHLVRRPRRSRPEMQAAQ